MLVHRCLLIHIKAERIPFLPRVDLGESEAVDPLGKAGVLVARNGVEGYGKAQGTEGTVERRLYARSVSKYSPSVQPRKGIRTPSGSATSGA